MCFAAAAHLERQVGCCIRLGVLLQTIERRPVLKAVSDLYTGGYSAILAYRT